MDGKLIAYYRVSTEHQGVNGNDRETRALLKVPDGGLGRWPEHAINNQTEDWSPPQCPLKAADGITSRARSDIRLTRIWHLHHHNDRNMNARIYVRMVWPFSNNKMWMKPTTGIDGCRARTISGHATAPPSPAMNSRRLMPFLPQTDSTLAPRRSVVSGGAFGERRQHERT